MDAIEYLKEKARLTEKCKIYCRKCRLSSDDAAVTCGKLEQLYPETAVAIMEQWSKDCPQKTRLQDFREKYPNALLNEISGNPKACCKHLGYCGNDEPCDMNCTVCWNTPLEE